MEYMTPINPRWEEFIESLCERMDGCSSDIELPAARATLTEMGFDAEYVQRTVDFFQKYGGYCDCEILMNVQHSVEARIFAENVK